MLRVLVIVGLVLGLAAARVHADTIALLPLDGEKRLEIYGQPVAAEIGRALKAAGYDVVVVGAKMDVPDKAQLIIDGTIKADKSNAITLSIRIRDAHKPTVLDTLPASAATLTAIDKAAADLSARIVPAVKTQLAALAKQTPPEVTITPREPPTNTQVEAPVATPRLPTALFAVSIAQPDAILALLASGLEGETRRWIGAHDHDVQHRDGHMLSAKEALKTVIDANADMAVAFDILGFEVEGGKVPLGRARVRARVVHGGRILFDRVMRTDTIVGDRNISEQEMAARTARAVLAILNAQLRLRIAGWR